MTDLEQEIKNSSQQVTLYIEEDNQLSNNLIDILKDNITKVQADKEYIPQAQAVNNNITTIVNIAKMRLDMMKHMKNINKTYGRTTKNSQTL